MNRRLRQSLVVLWRAEFFSAKDFLRRAVLISVVFLLAHAAGLREFTSVLNGTTGSVALGWEVSAFLGLTYIALHLAFVVLVPILILAAAILGLWRNLRRRNRACNTA